MKNSNDFVKIYYYNYNNIGYSIAMESGEIDVKRVTENFSDINENYRRSIRSVAKSMAVTLQKIHAKYYAHIIIELIK